MNIFIIGSALTVNNQLSVFSDEERFYHLTKTISSINGFDPHSQKILFDASPDEDINKKSIIESGGIKVIRTGDDPWIAMLSRQSRKSEGEAASTLTALKYIKYQNIFGKRIYKISGRYWLNDNFLPGHEHQNKFVFSRSLPTWYVRCENRNEEYLKQINADRYLQTRLWHMDYSLLEEAIDIFPKIIKDCHNHSIDLEHSFYKNFKNKNIAEVDRIGVSGNIAPNGVYVED
jgi:hypothetical protein